MSDHRSGFPMRRHASRTAAVSIAAAVTVVVALSGCAAQSGVPADAALSEQQGFPADAPIGEPFDDPTWAGQPVGWLAEDRATLTIVSYGSSSCPFIATAIQVVDESTVSIELRQAPAQACTDDLAPRTHVLEVLEGWGTGEGPYTAQIVQWSDAFGSSAPQVSTVELWPLLPDESIAVLVTSGVPDDVTLPSDSLDTGEPLAFWGPDRSTLRVITWGSSSCPPPALSLEVVSATELALVFGALPPQACAADFAPTTHVLAVPAGLDGGTITLGITIEQGDGANALYGISIAD